jgi:hypothetical protein
MFPWPFIGAEALASAAIPERAMRRNFQQLYPGVFVPKGVEPSVRQRAEAAWLWSGRRGVVAGQSAAALLGVKWVDRSEPAELIHDNRKPPARLVVRTERLGRHTSSSVRSVQRLDAIANTTGVTVADVEAVAAAHRGARDLRRLRRVLPLVDAGAESPQETVARLALIDAGLPSPRTQFEVFGRYGEFVARLDMAYDEVKVGIEYDGAQHWTDPAVRQRDIDKQFELTALDWKVIRVSSALLHQRRATYIARVVAAVSERGLRWCAR